MLFKGRGDRGGGTKGPLRAAKVRPGSRRRNAWFLALLAVFATILAVLPNLVADPYPPYWSGGTGAAVHYAPAPWPADGAWIPVTHMGVPLRDPKNSDPSTGGTTPNGYVSVTSGCTDQTLPSVYWAWDAAHTILFFRWRVESRAQTYYTSGNNPPSYSSSDPWNSALYTVLIDTDGDGYREFAMHLDGSSGSPSASVDILAGIYANDASQQIDYVTYPGTVCRTGHNPSAFVDQATGIVLNFHNTNTPDTTWPKPTTNTLWDFGTSRAVQASDGSCGEWFVDYQIPYAMLNSQAVCAHPTIDGNTPIALAFATANSLNNPYQKDFIANGAFSADATKCFPFSDYIIPAQGTTLVQPIVSSVTAVGCGTTTLTANVQSAIANVSGSCGLTVTGVAFYYYLDKNGDGAANDTGSAWTLAANASALTMPQWGASWDTSVMPNGTYLVGVQATSSSGVKTFSYLTQAQVNSQVGATPPNYANPSPTPGVKTASIVINCGVSTMISGYVYNDANHNGSMDAGEAGTGASGLYVKVCQGGSFVKSGAVDPSTGYYQVAGLANGAYTVMEGTNGSDCTAADPAGFVSTTPNSLTAVISAATPILSNVNFGDYNGCKVRGAVFHDRGNGAAGSTEANNSIYNSGNEPGLPGVIVRACADTSCATTITTTATADSGAYTLWVPGSYNGSTVYVIETDPAGYLSTGNSIGGVVQNNAEQSVTLKNRLSFTMTSGANRIDYNFGDVKNIFISPPQSYMVSPGASVTVRHTINIQTPGKVAVSFGSQKVWPYAVYADLNCDGVPDGNALAPSGGYYVLNGGANLGTGSVCVILRTVVSSSTPLGATEKLAVTASEDWANTAASYNDMDVLEDVIMVSNPTGELRLEKYVRNVTLGLGFTVSNQVSPCDVVEYRIDFKNIGASPQTAIVFGDNVPANTAFLTRLYNGGTRDVMVTVGSNTYYGNVLDGPDTDGVTLTGGVLAIQLGVLSGGAFQSLAPGQTGSIYYRVRVNGTSCP